MAGGWLCHPPLRLSPLRPEQLPPKAPFPIWHEKTRGTQYCSPSRTHLSPWPLPLPCRSQQPHKRPLLQVSSLLAYSQIPSPAWSLQWLPSAPRITLTRSSQSELFATQLGPSVAPPLFQGVSNWTTEAQASSIPSEEGVPNGCQLSWKNCPFPLDLYVPMAQNAGLSTQGLFSVSNIFIGSVPWFYRNLGPSPTSAPHKSNTRASQMPSGFSKL